MKESHSRRTMSLIQLRKEIVDVIETHGESAPQAFRVAMRRMVNEVFVLLAERGRAPLSTLFVFAEELSHEFADQTEIIDGEALRLHLYHVITQGLGLSIQLTSGKTVMASMGARVLH
jgi:hypothetical protein